MPESPNLLAAYQTLDAAKSLEGDSLERTAPPKRDETEGVPTEVLWSRLRDETASASDRAEALSNLLDISPEQVISHVVGEILRDDLSDEWRSALVFLAEDVHFPESSRQNIGERLLNIAQKLRLSTKAAIDKVVWSAMRRAVTLLPPDPARMLIFLDRGEGVIDTRSTALLCIERSFELAPPISCETYKPIVDRVADFAFKFLDPDVFAGGENALIAQNAVCALAALGDPRFDDAVASVRRLGRRWMNHQLRLRLEHLLTSWRSRGDAVASHPALRRIEEQLRSLV
jgi:hypothetical protein